MWSIKGPPIRYTLSAGSTPIAVGSIGSRIGLPNIRNFIFNRSCDFFNRAGVVNLERAIRYHLRKPPPRNWKDNTLFFLYFHLPPATSITRRKKERRRKEKGSKSKMGGIEMELEDQREREKRAFVFLDEGKREGVLERERSWVTWNATARRTELNQSEWLAIQSAGRQQWTLSHSVPPRGTRGALVLLSFYLSLSL